MPKLNEIKPSKTPVPFVNTDELNITTHINEQNKIVKFVVTLKKEGKVKEFAVGKDWNILEQWIKVEEFCKHLK